MQGEPFQSASAAASSEQHWKTLINRTAIAPGLREFICTSVTLQIMLDYVEAFLERVMTIDCFHGIKMKI